MDGQRAAFTLPIYPMRTGSLLPHLHRPGWPLLTRNKNIRKHPAAPGLLPLLQRIRSGCGLLLLQKQQILNIPQQQIIRYQVPTHPSHVGCLLLECPRGLRDLPAHHLLHRFIHQSQPHHCCRYFLGSQKRQDGLPEMRQQLHELRSQWLSLVFWSASV